MAATPAFAFQTVTASPPDGGARKTGSPSAAEYGTHGTTISDVNSARKVTTLMGRLFVWVFMVQSSRFSCRCSFMVKPST